MIIVGEKLNGTSKPVQEAIDKRDASFVTQLARAQRDAGADYIDVNAGIFYDDEPERLEWLVSAIRREVDVRFSLDTSNSETLRPALKIIQNEKPLINSITAQKRRFQAVLPLVKEFDTSVVALCMNDGGLPNTADGRIAIARDLVERLTGAGLCHEAIFLDPIVRPIGIDSSACITAIETIKEMKKRWPGIHIICGVSNISYGIPARRLMNRTFLAAAVIAGLDCAILDPLDDDMLRSICAAEALAGVDKNCERYINQYRESGLKE